MYNDCIWWYLPSTARDPPGRKQFWTSMTKRASLLPLFSAKVMKITEMKVPVSSKNFIFLEKYFLSYLAIFLCPFWHFSVKHLTVILLFLITVIKNMAKCFKTKLVSYLSCLGDMKLTSLSAEQLCYIVLGLLIDAGACSWIIKWEEKKWA